MQFLSKKKGKNLEKSGKNCEKIAEKILKMSRMKHFNIKNFNSTAMGNTIFAISCCVVHRTVKWRQVYACDYERSQQDMQSKNKKYCHSKPQRDGMAALFRYRKIICTYAVYKRRRADYLIVSSPPGTSGPYG